MTISLQYLCHHLHIHFWWPSVSLLIKCDNKVFFCPGYLERHFSAPVELLGQTYGRPMHTLDADCLTKRLA